MRNFSMAAMMAVLVLSPVFTASTEGAGFSCDFRQTLARQWRLIGGKWEVKDGCLKQVDPGTDDPTKALLVLGDGGPCAEVAITARLRIDAWNEGAYARAGVSVCSDPISGRGLNLVFHQGQLKFMQDYVAWGPACAFPFSPGKWYWMKLSREAGTMRGKAWADGDREPADWMVAWQQPDEEITGYAGLVGGSGAPGAGLSAVSFSGCEVAVVALGPPAYYAKKATWLETMVASRETLARQGDPMPERLWRLLHHDFPDAQSRREIAAERQDQIWSKDWPSGKLEVLADRYAAATRAGMATQAGEFAKDIKSLAELEPVRRLYHRSREIDAALARWKDADLQSLRLAVEDLTRTYGPRYSKGPEYLRRIAEMEATIAEARAPGGKEVAGTRRVPSAAELRHTACACYDGGSSAAQRMFEAIQLFDALRREALLSNPLLDFDRLLLVKRKDARAYSPMPRFPIPPLAAGPGHLLNGLPLNYQGNAVLRQVPIENEIAVLSLHGPDGHCSRHTPRAEADGTRRVPATFLATVFRPETPAYVGEVKLHFDADRLLFSSIGTKGRFQIFEISVDGKQLRQVTRGEDDDIDNYDACYLPDGRILFGSSVCFQSVPCQRRHDEVANLCVMRPDGSDVRRLCFDQDHNFYPSVLSDGRVLYTRWEYTDIAHAFSARLFTMNPDGTAQRAYYASSSFWPNRIFYAKQVPDHPSRFVGIVTGHHGTPRAGELVLFDAASGRRQAQGAVQGIPGRAKKVEAVLHDTLVDSSWPKFLHPFPLSDKYFLVSCQPTADSWWGLYLVDVFDNMLLLCEEDGWAMFEPSPLRKTPCPPVIPHQIDLKSREATVYLRDIYVGEGLKGIPRGTVKQLRLFTYHFNYWGTSGIEDYIGMDGPWDVRRVLGTVPVAQDGSARFTVPANTPIAIQPLDAEGKALQLMRSWFTAMPGEAVSCVGCHEQTNSSPSAVGHVANVPSGSKAVGWDESSSPTGIGKTAGLEDSSHPTISNEPSRIKPWRGPVRGFSWDREVQPVLDKFCVGCHDGRTPPDLRRAEPKAMPLAQAPFPPSYYVLRRFVRSPGIEGDPRVLPPADYHADINPLVRMLRKGHHNVQLDEEAWDRLITWMDMNAPAYGTWLEIPTVRGNAAVRRYRDRRNELLRRYGGVDEDPEAVLDAPSSPISPVMPPPEAAPAPPERFAGWPFTADEARRRQATADPTEMEIDLGSGVKMQLVRIPAGEFVMGEPAGYGDERPAFRAKIDRPFWMGKVEVTNEQYARFDPTHASGLEPMIWLKWTWEDYADLNQPRQPVCRVSWEQAGAFCQWLSQKTGRKFSLPNEAQWEWACRAGAETPLNFGPLGADSAPFANLADASLLSASAWARTTTPWSRTERVQPFYAADPVNDKNMVSSPVGAYRVNPWGLHDMHGNVSEWTASAYLPYPFRADDPRDADPRARRVVRGGSWYDRADLARSACRTGYWPWQRVFDVGFRVVCE